MAAVVILAQCLFLSALFTSGGNQKTIAGKNCWCTVPCYNELQKLYLYFYVVTLHDMIVSWNRIAKQKGL